MAVSSYLDKGFLLFGGTGLVTMARGGIDMAMWDALAKRKGMPLFRLLGVTQQPTLRAYESSGLGISNAAEVADEAKIFARSGFSAMKIRVGYENVQEDISVISAVRSAVGEDVELMVDYNQALKFDEALDRCRALDYLGLDWIEEPIHAADLENTARICAAIKTPIQIGENIFNEFEVERAISLKACRYLMPDVMKIGGATHWLIAAHHAEKTGIGMSSHFFPEISAHLLASVPNRHFLEYANWMENLLESPVSVVGGEVRR